MAYVPVEHHPAFEEYSEAIFELAEDGVDVIQARIAERLDVSRPAVSEMVRKMQREGLVELSPSSSIELTDDGRRLAVTVVRRHRLAERFLTDVLNLSWADAHHEAGRWEHVISPVVEAALVRILDDPTTCPHGNPIPGSTYSEPTAACSLSELPPGDRFRVERIPEELEFQVGQLEYLEGADVVPGRIGVLRSIAPDGTATVDMGGRVAGLSAFASERILVSTLSD